MRGFVTLLLLASAAWLYGETPADWIIPLREALYAQTMKADAIVPLYQEAQNRARQSLSGAELYAMLARCEYMMGRAYQDNKQDADAIARFEQGIAWAEQALDIEDTAEGHEMLAGNIAQVCMLKPVPWVMANGLKVEQHAKKALALNPRNAAAGYFIASRWVFGPGLLGNPQKGIAEMEAMLGGKTDLQKDDLFNVYSAIGYGYIRLKKYADALPWVQKSLELYGTNKYAGDMLSQIQQAGH